MKILTRFTAAALCGALAAPAAAHHDAEWTPLLAPAALAEMAEHGDVTLIDIRAPKDYAAGHVEGALNAPYPAWRGPKENPGAPLTDAALTDLLRSLGLTPDSAVIVTYEGKDQTDFGAAARVYWTLKSAGLSRIAILNGGLAAWKKADLPLSTDTASVAPSDATFTLSGEWMADTAEVEKIVSGETAGVTIDARPTEFYQGTRKHDAARRGGTLKGAQNLAHTTWFEGEATEILGAEDIISRLAKAGQATETEGEIVSFCNTGHWAATNWFVLSELAGIDGVKLYPESMVGWTAEGRDTYAAGQSKCTSC